MALFGRGDSPDAIIKKLESGACKDADEKSTLLATLAGSADLKPEVLLRFVTGTDPDLARFAVGLYGSGRDPRALDRLLTALPRLPQARWRHVIAAIHRIESPLLGDRLGQLLRGKNASQRTAAMEILGGHPSWNEHLHLIKAAMRDPDDGVRSRAVQILRRGLDQPPVIELLRAQLDNEDEAVRHTAIKVLCEAASPELIEDFFDRLPEESPRIQEMMIRALSRMLRGGGSQGERVLERLLPLLAAEDERIRDAAAKLLASMPDKLHVLRRFLQYAKGLAFWLRDRSFAAVAGVADNLADGLLALMREEDLDVVVGATVMAAKTKDARVVAGLEEVLRDARFEWWVKVPLLESLAEFQHPAVTRILIDALEDEDLTTSALMSLGRRGEPGTLSCVLRFLEHPRRGRRRTALDALAILRDPRALPQLERVARGDADEECRVLALEVLDQYGAEGVATAAAIREERREAPPAAAHAGPELELTMLDPTHPNSDA